MRINRTVIGYFLYFLSVIALIAPTVVLFYLKRDVYFIDNQVDLSVGAILTLFSVILLLKGGLSDLNKHFKTVFWIAIAMGISHFMESILNDLFWILLCALIGYLLFIILNAFAMRNITYGKTYFNERARIEARSDYNAGNV